MEFKTLSKGATYNYSENILHLKGTDAREWKDIEADLKIFIKKDIYDDKGILIGKASKQIIERAHELAMELEIRGSQDLDICAHSLGCADALGLCLVLNACGYTGKLRVHLSGAAYCLDKDSMWYLDNSDNIEIVSIEFRRDPVPDKTAKSIWNLWQGYAKPKNTIKIGPKRNPFKFSIKNLIFFGYEWHLNRGCHSDYDWTHPTASS